MKKRIVISVTNDLITDQRVHRIASTLHGDYDILLVGRKLKTSQEIKRDYETKRFRLLFNKGPLFYACYNMRLFFFLLFVNADIFLSNDLDTIVANFRASKIRKKVLVYDSHEYFTEVPELTDRPKVKNFWTRIESKRLPKIKYAYTVCESLSEIYNEKYGIDMKVIRNVPFYREPETKTENKKKIIIYQGALNLGRGIEKVINAMLYIEDAEFHIYGDGDITESLKNLTHQLDLNHKIKFLGRQPLEELHKFTQMADLGVSLEQNMGLNYYYALPNKLFDYIQARIPVLTSDFPEMKKIINEFKVGKTINDHDPKILAKTIKEMLAEGQEKYSKKLEVAANELCWENEQNKLFHLFKNLI